MFSNSLEDDDDDFSLGPGKPKANSRLSSLFGANPTGGSSGQSLTYTAPKQPTKSQGEPQQQASTEAQQAPLAVIQAAKVHCYKLVNSEYVPQGVLGAALLGNKQSLKYQILLYVNKQSPVCIATFHAATKFEVLANQYARFYDDQKQLFSIRFESAGALEAFATQVGLCLGSLNLSKLTLQDLKTGEGGGLVDGDSAELKYAGWIFSSGDKQQLFDSNMETDKTFRLKIGRGKVIKGWELGLLGLATSGKRLIIIPPDLAYGSSGVSGRIPPHSALVFEVVLLRMKGNKPTDEFTPLPPQPQTEESEEPVVQKPAELTVDEQSVKGRTKSISEQLEHSGVDKGAQLKQRMAKLGTAMLPQMVQPQAAAQPQHPHEQPTPVYHPHSQQPEVVTDHTPYDTSLVRPEPRPQSVQSAFQPVPIQSGHTTPSPAVGHFPHQHSFTGHSPAASSELIQLQNQLEYQRQALVQQQMMAQGMNPGLIQPGGMQLASGPSMHQLGGYQPANQMSGLQTPTPMAGYSHTPNQMQGFQLPANQNQHQSPADVNRKLDSILEQVEAIGGNSSNLPSMETRTLLENLTRIIKENEKMKEEQEAKTLKIDQQTAKISGLLEQNQRYMEQSNQILEQRNDTFKSTATQSQSQILELQREKVSLTEELSSVTSQVASLQTTLKQQQQSAAQLKQELAEANLQRGQLKEQLELLTTSSKEAESQVTILTDNLKTEKSKRREAEAKLGQQEEELTELQETNAQVTRALTERKQRFTEERNRFHQELEELQQSHHKELESLREKYKKQSNEDSSLKLSDLEQDLEARWKEKVAAAVRSERKEAEKRLGEMEAEKQQLLSGAARLKQKLVSLKEMYDEKLEEIQALQDEAEESQTWKAKFEKVKEFTVSMKQNYEEQLAEMEERMDAMKQRTRSIFGSLLDQFEEEAIYSGASIKALVQALAKGKKDEMIQPIKSQASQSVPVEESIQPTKAASQESTAQVTSAEMAHKLGDKGIENTVKETKVKPRVAHKLGDKGIENAVIEESIQPAKAASQESTAQVTSAEVAHKLGDKGIENTVKESKVKPKVAHKLGDKGIENTVKEESIQPAKAASQESTAQVTSADMAHKLGDKGIENTVKESKLKKEVAHKLGDKGIENTVKEESIQPAKAASQESTAQVTSAEVAHKLGDKGIENTIKESKMKKEVAHKLGDKGIENTVKEESIQPAKAASQESTAQVTSAEVAHKLGDKGIENTVKESKVKPQVAHKLGDKGIENTVKEESIQPAKAASQESTAQVTSAEVAHKLGDKGIENTVKESKTKKEVAHKLGDKGIENTVKEESIQPAKAVSQESTAQVTSAEVAHKLGDKGIENTVKESKVKPKVAHKLGDKGIENTVKEESIQPAKAASQESTAQVTLADMAHKLGDKGIENTVKESKMKREVAHKLGDKGIENTVKEESIQPAKAASQESTAQVTSAEVAHKLGDKGIENTIKESKVKPKVAHKLGEKGIENTVKEPRHEAQVAHKLGGKGAELFDNLSGSDDEFAATFSKKPSNGKSVDAKEKPPPLFDDDDDEDLDWLS